ncbi:SRPBCC family protein [Speluncibacter jeojiensis]|uniref:SRPBCC family protein n=1 Tax=Speluncibacter jeojiensis TaxID=2710754 RepID=A0A9X4M1Z4_9ACTN|nr:SRPBCC family protein [Corynebacteriales bacterium D3-21]
MLMRDTPTVEVTERLSCSPERAWELVTDIELPTRAEGELKRAEWLDGATGVAVGARFRGHNANAQLGEWSTDPQIVEVEDGRRWVWSVGPVDDPFSFWGFEVDADGDGSIVRQWAKVGTGRSPLTDFVEQHPGKEAAILEGRMSVWRDGMAANLAMLKALVG